MHWQITQRAVDVQPGQVPAGTPPTSWAGIGGQNINKLCHHHRCVAHASCTITSAWSNGYIAQVGIQADSESPRVP